MLEQRDRHPGLVHVISTMERCDTYRPWHDKQTHDTCLRPDSGKCLHDCLYFMDGEPGRVHLRVPTWAPFRLVFPGKGTYRDDLTKAGRAATATAERLIGAVIVPAMICWDFLPQNASRASR